MANSFTPGFYPTGATFTTSAGLLFRVRKSFTAKVEPKKGNTYCEVLPGPPKPDPVAVQNALLLEQNELLRQQLQAALTRYPVEVDDDLPFFLDTTNPLLPRLRMKGGAHV